MNKADYEVTGTLTVEITATIRANSGAEAEALAKKIIFPVDYENDTVGVELEYRDGTVIGEPLVEAGYSEINWSWLWATQ